ncbi:MAG: YybS family protein [Candidatus Cellulosilyticum pullistercoris]|uniref:YybS family protein n=1 Tax=Candidatus Cellulosilyticum pullistercoris TaxID=2838521 RepID=A0A9E2NP56_9FIRM|nr:YybS family protein [Candidatus Cellulosilyticum pullistercoris]
MEASKKNVTKFIGIMICYILLSALGIFSQEATVLFPIFSLPFALYCMRNKLTINMHLIFHIVVSTVIYLLTGSPYCILIYIVGVMIPSYVILFLYKQRLSLPNIMMYTGLGLAAVVFGYFAIMKAVGSDFEAQFAAALDEVSRTFASTMDSALQFSISAGTSTPDLQQAVTQMKMAVASGVEALKVLYAAIIVFQMVIASSVTVIIFNAIARRKDKTLPRLREILEFRVSKVAVLLLMGCMLVSDFSTNMQGPILVLGLNIMWFLMNLLQITGTLGLIALLRNTSVSTPIKVLGYIVIVILFMFSPYIVMFFGCLDAIFNYRKVKIVV